MNVFPFKAIYPNLDFITSAESFFGTVKVDYVDYFNSGFFKKSENESLYIYQIRTKRRTFTGLIGCSSVKDYLAGHIKKHEDTLAAKEQQQLHLLLQRGSMVKPILLVYKDVEAISAIFYAFIEAHEPFYSITFENNQETHSMWEISETAIVGKIQEYFQRYVPNTYIADGHHRTSSLALLFNRRKGKKDHVKYQKLLAAYFPASEMEIHDYNRIVEILDNISISEFLVKLSQIADIELLANSQKPLKSGEIVMFVNREWYKFYWKDHIRLNEKGVPQLDAALLDKHVLQNICGIRDIRNDERMRYAEGTLGLMDLENRTLKNANRVAFCLYPVQLEDLFSIADAGEIMPPKSTWFVPRMKNGLIVKEV